MSEIAPEPHQVEQDSLSEINRLSLPWKLMEQLLDSRDMADASTDLQGTNPNIEYLEQEPEAARRRMRRIRR